MSGEVQYGNCKVCGKVGPLVRTYFYYDVKCECHSPNHFEIVYHCDTCIPEEPEQTKITIKTEELNKLEVK